MKKLLSQYKTIILICLVPYLFITLAGIIRVDYDIVSPGGLNKVENIIEVEGGKTQQGSFNTVSVYSVERISLLTYLLGKIDNIVSIDETSEYVQMTTTENYTSGSIQKNVSINNAIILAYKLANKKIVTQYHGLIVHTVFKDIAYNMKIGDVITKYNGVNVTNEIDFENQLVEDVRNKKTIILTISRQNTTFEIEYEPIWINDNTRFYVGFSYYDYYTIVKEETSPSFQINYVNTLGPSGGLMQALSIYNAISETDLTNGKKIAGTGTIDTYGDVGPIGGIYQKVFTAYYSNSDIFFVPVERDENGDIIIVEGNNYSEALEAYQKLGSPADMAFVPVATIQEAINYLESIK